MDRKTRQKGCQALIERCDQLVAANDEVEDVEGSEWTPPRINYGFILIFFWWLPLVKQSSLVVVPCQHVNDTTSFPRLLYITFYIL